MYSDSSPSRGSISMVVRRTSPLCNTLASSNELSVVLTSINICHPFLEAGGERNARNFFGTDLRLGTFHHHSVRRGKIRDDSTAHPRNLDGFGSPELLLVTEDVVEISYSSFQFQVIKFVSIPLLSRERKDLNLDFRNFRLWRIERSKISFRHANNQGEEGIVNCIFVERR